MTLPAHAQSKLPDLDTLWNFDDPAASEAKFRAVLPDAKASGDVTYTAILLTQIARAQGLQERSEAAHRTLDEAQALVRDDMKAARVWLALERGRAFNGIPRDNDPDATSKRAKARPCFVQAWELARAAGEDQLAADAAHMLGIIEPPEEALAWGLRAMEVAEKSSDPKARRWLGPLYNNLGWTYHDRGDYEKALDLFQRGVAFRKERGQAKELRIARWTVGRALRSLKRLDEALAIQRDLEKEWAASGEPQDGYVFEELAECLLALGRAEESRPWFAKAFEVLSKDEWLAKSEAPRLERMRELGTKR